ncbi:MAG: hypothetical protein QW367_04010, partial [Candidatus Aenigmatarchaeota archaeon]
MNKPLNTPEDALHKNQGKDTEFQPIKLNPVFDDLNNPTTILNHIEELKNKSEATPHAEILHQLIEQIEPLDFDVLAFPQVKELREQLKKAE